MAKDAEVVATAKVATARVAYAEILHLLPLPVVMARATEAKPAAHARATVAPVHSVAMASSMVVNSAIWVVVMAPAPQLAVAPAPINPARRRLVHSLFQTPLARPGPSRASAQETLTKRSTVSRLALTQCPHRRSLAIPVHRTLQKQLTRELRMRRLPSRALLLPQAPYR